jgi:hypothetical protein
MRTFWIAGICILATVALALTGCRGGAPVVTSGAQLPDRLAIWLPKDLAQSGIGHAVSADWVLTTHGQAAKYTSGADPSDPTPVYLFDVHGKFVWDHSCPPQAPRASCVSNGTDEIFTVDPQSLQVIGLTVGSRSPDLSNLGEHGHVSL